MAAAAVRRAHPRPVPGRRWWCADQEHRRLAAAPDAVAGRPTRPTCPTSRRSRTTTRSSRCSAAGATAAGRRRSWPSRPRSRGPGPRPGAPALAVRAFTADVDTAWRRTSYSSLSAVRPRPCPARRRGGQRARGGRQGRRGPRADRSTLAAHLARPRTRLRTCRRRWPTCRWARRSARSCTPCSSTPTRPPPTCAPSCSRHIDEQRGWWPVELDREELADALVAVCDSPLGPARAGGVTLREIPLPTGCARSTSSCRWPAATSRRPRPRPTSGSATSPRCSSGTCPRATRCAATPRRSSGPLGGQPLRGYLTGSIDVVLRVPRRRAAPATWSSTTRPTGSARPTSR